MNTKGHDLGGQSYVFAVSDEDFSAKALGAALPVLVEVGAPSCAPCRLMDPIIDDLAREYHGRMLFLTLDADDNPRTSMMYGVQGLPTVLIFHHGQLIQQVTGARPRADLKRRLEQTLAMASA